MQPVEWMYERRDEFPALYELLTQGAYRGWEEYFLDPADAMGTALYRQKQNDPDLSSLRRELVELLERYPSDAELDEVSEALGAQAPEQWSYRRWFERILLQVDEGPHAPMSPAMPKLPRASRFTDEETANEAATQVLRRHEPQLRSWADGSLGFRRLHLYADVGRPVGTVVEGGDPDHPRTVTGCVVVMRKDPERGNPYVATAYPEIPLDEGVRAAYPDLPQLFGAHFSQDCDAIDGSVWLAEVNFHVGASKDAKQRVSRQLEALLAATPDAELPSALTALGSYVLPAQPRAWLERILDRLGDRALWIE